MLRPPPDWERAHALLAALRAETLIVVVLGIFLSRFRKFASRAGAVLLESWVLGVVSAPSRLPTVAALSSSSDAPVRPARHRASTLQRRWPRRIASRRKRIGIARHRCVRMHAPPAQAQSGWYGNKWLEACQDEQIGCRGSGAVPRRRRHDRTKNKVILRSRPAKAAAPDGLLASPVRSVAWRRPLASPRRATVRRAAGCPAIRANRC